ncbi:Ankyrin repeat [Melia azedarach]|uniref:Ankyrin repeat n=1 Tax=Melia azedarach TaxID=155640 RepID=A0ACC1Y2N0_MELAZ|nr:Ankyrin repeat [Melia azedarach]
MEEANEAKQHKDDEMNITIISKQDKEQDSAGEKSKPKKGLRRTLTNEDQRRLITMEQLQATTKLDHAKTRLLERQRSCHEEGQGKETRTQDAGMTSNTIYENEPMPIDPNRNKDGTTEMEPKTLNKDDLDEQAAEVESSEVNWLAYWPLCKMIQENYWKSVEDFVRDHPEALTAEISYSKTIFHHIVNFIHDDIEGAACVIDKFASKVNPRTLEQKDIRGMTVLSLSATIGNTWASKLLVKYNSNLPNVWSDNGWLPVQHAAYYDHKDTVQYLVRVTAEENLVGSSGARLISYLIMSNLYDVALDFLKQYPAIGRDHFTSRNIVLETLAQKPLAFASGNQLGSSQCFIYNRIPLEKEKISTDQTNKNPSAGVDVESAIVRSRNYSMRSTCVGSIFKIATILGAMCQDLHMMFWNALILLFPCIKAIHEQKLTHLRTLEIIRMICDGVVWNDPQIFKTGLFLHTAATFGISEFVNEIILAYNDSIYQVNNEGHHIFHLAVLHRHENVFNLIHGFRHLSDMLNMYDHLGNNMLHLAGKLVPSSKVLGAALQMQRELQWFKAIENLLRPWLHEEKNSDNKTPREVFTESHKELVKEGEKWMDTAQSCAIAATLIITVVFAAAFTVPGGNNNEGKPIFLKEKSFLIFATSDALTLFSSITSLLMFLAILTSRYSEEDFLMSLPRKLIIGLITLFFSIVTMIVAFGATIYIVLSQPWKWVSIPIALLGCVPVTMFALVRFSLLHDMAWAQHISSSEVRM